jgi:hypothetical protein
LIGFFAERVEIKKDSRQCAIGQEKKEKKWLLGFLILKFQKILNRICQISILGIQENGRMLKFFHFHILCKRVTPLEQ